jgi:hypothetical protein
MEVCDMALDRTTTGSLGWKSRVRVHGNHAGKYENHETISGIPVAGRDGFVSDLRNEAQTIMSQSNPVQYLGKKGHPEEIGGPFESYKVRAVLDSWNPETAWSTSSGRSASFIPMAAPELGTVLNVVTPVSGYNPGETSQVMAKIKTLVPPRISDNTLDVWGTQVIASITPTNPVADLSTTLAELASEGKFFELPSEKSTLSGGYLNYQFGVAPTVGFAKDLRKAVENRDAIISQYERDAGKRIRRQFNPPPIVDTTVKQVRTSAPLYAYGLGTVAADVGSIGTCTVTTKTQTWYWFSGAFTYYIPKRDSVEGDLARLDKLYGVNPLNNLAGTAYELTPYSWLVDYFASAGAYQKNIDAFRQDGLVMPYAYVMADQTITQEFQWVGLVRKGATTVTRTFGGRLVKQTSQRRRATPYGFGKSSSSLTTKQLSILAALGISRVF